jgi:hypothetical protein
MIIEAASVLKSQEKIVDDIKLNMDTLSVGKEYLALRLAEEAKKRGASASTLDAAAALVSGAGSKAAGKRKSRK